MAVTQTITLTKDSATFASAVEAGHLFLSECASAQLTTIFTYNQDAITSGDMIESIALKSSNDGFVITRTWTDAKWAEAELYPAPTISNGWSRSVTIT